MTRWLALLCRLGVGSVLLVACWNKLLQPQAFAEAVSNYHMVPYALLHPFAHLLPVLEAVVGAALVLGVARRGAALLAGGMTVMFIVAIGTALARGLDISCGCFETEGGHGVGMDLLLRDVLLLAACLPPLLARDAGPALDHWFRRR